MKNIIWQKPDGGVAVTKLYEATDSRAEAERLKKTGDVPSDWKAVSFDTDIPQDRSNRRGWKWDGGKVLEGKP